MPAKFILQQFPEVYFEGTRPA